MSLKGSDNLVYLDESGFEEYIYRPYGWSTAWFYMVGKPDRSPSSKRGQKTYGDRNGKRGTRTSLIAGKRGRELLAPILFRGSTNALWFNRWLEEHLVPELKPNSTLILDQGLARIYAAFHRKDDVFRIAEQAGHQVWFLPPYSPDFNRIEQDFRTASLIMHGHS